MKTGDTVRLTCIFKDSDDNPKSLADYRVDVDFIHPRNGTVVVSTNSREGGGIVIHESSGDDGTIENKGEYTVHGGNSRDWPLGKMTVDVLYSRSTDTIHTDDFYLEFTKGRSRIIDER